MTEVTVKAKKSVSKGPIKVLSTKHRRMARAKYAGNLTAKQLAKEFGMNWRHVGERIMCSPVFKNYIKDLEEFDGYEQGILRRKLEGMGDSAVEALADDLKVKPDTHLARRVRQSAAKDVLDRIDVVGEAKRRRVDEDTTPKSVTNITQINIKELTIAEKHDLASRLMQQQITI